MLPQKVIRVEEVCIIALRDKFLQIWITYVIPY